MTQLTIDCRSRWPQFTDLVIEDGPAKERMVLTKGRLFQHGEHIMGVGPSSEIGTHLQLQRGVDAGIGLAQASNVALEVQAGQTV